MKSTSTFLLACLCASFMTAPLFAVSFRTVAVTGDAAAQPVGAVDLDLVGADFSNLLSLVKLNNAGQATFSGTLVGPDIDPLGNDFGAWSEGSGSLALVTLRENQAPGTSFGTQQIPLETPEINHVGDTAMRLALAGPGVDEDNGLGVFSQSSGTLGLVARGAEHAPGTPGGVVFQGYGTGIGIELYIKPIVFNNAGQTAFGALLTGAGVTSSNDVGIWSEGTGALSLVARTGSQAIGMAPGVTYERLVTTLTLNSSGQMAFTGWVEGTGVIEDVNDYGIWSSGPISNELVVRAGTQAPGAAFGVNFESFQSPHINSANDIAFKAILTGGGVDTSNDSGIWSEGSGIVPGTIGLVAREGDHAPGTAAGVSFGNLRSPVFNAEGETAFIAELAGTGVDSSNDTGLWSEGFGSLSLVAREGEHAPGTDPDVVFASIDSSQNIPSLNVLGQVAFVSQLAGVGIDSSNDYGIWAQDADGVLQLIAREGDTMMVVASGLGVIEERTIDVLQFTTSFGDDDGRSGGFNDLGQIAFSARFTDGSSGVFVTRLPVAVPEPSALLLFVTGVGALCGRRNRRLVG